LTTILPRRPVALVAATAVCLAAFATVATTPADAAHGPNLSVTDAYTGPSPRAFGTPCPCPEGNSGTKSFNFDLTLDEPSLVPIVVDYSTTDGTATTADADYVGKNGSETFLPGQTLKTVSVTVNGDTRVEPEETFALVVTAAPAAHIADGEGLAQIANDDVASVPTFTIADTSAAEDAGTMQFTVSLTRPSGTETTSYSISYATTDGTASSGLPISGDGDFDSTSGSLTFGSGVTTKTIDVTLNDDSTYEGNETFSVDLSGAPNGTLIGRSRATGTILENESYPTLTVTGNSRAEDAPSNQPLVFTVALAPPSSQTVTVNWATADGSAKVADNDYVAANGTLTYAPGQTSKTIEVDQTADANIEPDETVTLSLTGVQNAQVGTIAPATITNDDSGPRSLRFDGASLTEGDSGTQKLQLTLQLNGYSDEAITVRWQTQDATGQNAATSAGDNQDYVPVAATNVTIPAGQAAKTVEVAVRGDQRDEDDEIFFGRILEVVSGPATVASSFATAMIVDDDPKVSIADAVIDEGDADTRPMTFTISLSTPALNDVTVDWATQDGSAEAGKDYEAGSGTVSIPTGKTAATVTVDVIGDKDVEGDETFTVALSNPKNAVLGDASAVGRIRDDEAVVPQVDAGPDRTLDTEEVATFAATLKGGTGGATVTWDFGDGSTPKTGEKVTHRYTQAGTFEVTATASHPTGGTSSDKLTVSVADGGTVARLQGADRVRTAIAAARAHWRQAPTVLLATADTFPDALAASALAAVEDSPLLLTPGTSLPDDVLALLDDLRTESVRILGGPNAVSPGIEEVLVDRGFAVERIAGVDRFDTAARIAAEVGPDAGFAVVALGAHVTDNRAWPDALSAGAYAALGSPPPVLLTAGGSVPAVTMDALADLGVGRVELLGGTGAVAAAVEEQLTAAGYAVTRVAGDNRYATSAAVAARLLGSLPAGQVRLVFATGEAFPDGLTAGALAGRLGGPVVLVHPSAVPDPVADFLTGGAQRFDRGDLLGGPGALSESVRIALEDLLRR
jgi:putative cell wall-binding protein